MLAYQPARNFVICYVCNCSASLFNNTFQQRLRFGLVLIKFGCILHFLGYFSDLATLPEGATFSLSRYRKSDTLNRYYESKLSK